MAYRNRSLGPSDGDRDGGATTAGGKTSVTQRLVRSGAPSVPPPVQRHVDPVAAAIQRRQLERALDAAFNFSDDRAPVQRAVDAHTGLDDDQLGAHAAAGVAGSGTALPHLATIQRAFGPDHDLSGVRAHVGGAAAEASTAIGAHAYATGNDVAFAREPDLFLAAHEATHIVQQRQGVHLKGAVGQAGDTYEQHADQVAAAVVRGDDVSAMLGGGGGTTTGLQRYVGNLTTAKGYGATFNFYSAKLTAWGDAPPGKLRHDTNDLGGDGTMGGLRIPATYAGGLVQIEAWGTYDYGDGYLFDTTGTFEVHQTFSVEVVDGEPTVAPHGSADKSQLPSPMQLTVTPTPLTSTAGLTTLAASISIRDTQKTPTTTVGGNVTADTPKAGPLPSAKGTVSGSYTSGGNTADDSLVRTYRAQLVTPDGKPRKRTSEPKDKATNDKPGQYNLHLDFRKYIFSDSHDDNSKDSHDDNSKDSHDNNSKSDSHDNNGKSDSHDNNSKDSHDNNSKSDSHDNNSKDSHDTKWAKISLGDLPPAPKPGQKPTIPKELQNWKFYFAYGKSSLSAVAEQTGTTPAQQLQEYFNLLDSIEEAYAAAGRDFENPWTLLNDKTFIIKFTGKASSAGGDKANLKLSEQRAHAIQKAFTLRQFEDPTDKADHAISAGDGERAARQDYDDPSDRFVKVFWAAHSSK